MSSQKIYCDGSRFSGLCARCGHCLQACLPRILIPDLGGLVTPAVDFARDYCDAWCYQCTRVCPTGAIQRLTLKEKRWRSMGMAQIDRHRCLAWSQQQYCVVCNEFCPYQAVRLREHRGVSCPEVEEALCRRCGACQSHCPAHPRKAIIVQGLAQHPWRRS